MLGVGVESVCSQAQGRVVGVRDRARELLLHIFQLGEYQYVNMLTYDMNASYFRNRSGATIHFHIIFL